MTNNLKQSPYLRDQRKFPRDDVKNLSEQMDHAYIDIANKVNARTIGTFAINSQIVTGEKWYLDGQEGQPQQQQTLRQIYEFTAAGSIPHDISFNDVSFFTKPSGSFTDGENYYGVIYGSSVEIVGQVSFYIDSVNINIMSEATAPAIQNGIIILEWLAKY